MGIEWRPAPGATRILGRFFRDNGGAMAIMVALLIPVLIGMMGITVDVSLWYMSKRSLQNSADAAAVSGSLEIANGNSPGAAIAAQADAIRNGYDETDGSVMSINIPPVSGPSAGLSTSIEVIITRPMPVLFSTLFLDTSFVATVRAVANATPSLQAGCFVSLDPAGRDAIGFQSAQAQLTGCGITVNSNDARALTIGGNSPAAWAASARLTVREPVTPRPGMNFTISGLPVSSV